MKLTHLSEPPLEFGGAMRHVDIRFGLMDYGPFDFGTEGAPKHIKIGIVGSADTVEGTARWLETCQRGFDAKPSRQPNLFPAFPGLSFEETFRCEFITSDELQRVLPREASGSAWPARDDARGRGKHLGRDRRAGRAHGKAGRRPRCPTD